MFIRKGVCEFVGRCGGGRHWTVGTENEFLNEGIIIDEGNGNLPREREGAGGEVYLPLMHCWMRLGV